MSLITCPNCGRKGISTKAYFCVGCHCSMERINELLSDINKHVKEISSNSNSIQEKTVLKKQLSCFIDKHAGKANGDSGNVFAWLEKDNRDDMDNASNNVEDIEEDTNFNNNDFEKGEEIENDIIPDDVDWDDIYDGDVFDESENDAENYLSEYKECLDNLFNDDWFYPDYDEEEKFEDSYIPLNELEEFDDGYDVYKDCPELLEEYEEKEWIDADNDY